MAEQARGPGEASPVPRHVCAYFVRDSADTISTSHTRGRARANHERGTGKHWKKRKKENFVFFFMYGRVIGERGGGSTWAGGKLLTRFLSEICERPRNARNRSTRAKFGEGKDICIGARYMDGYVLHSSCWAELRNNCVIAPNNWPSSSCTTDSVRSRILSLFRCFPGDRNGDLSEGSR